MSATFFWKRSPHAILDKAMTLSCFRHPFVPLFIFLLLTPGTVGAADIPSIENSKNCFGFDTSINYFAEESWFEGSPRPAGFTLASAFNFGLLMKHSTRGIKTGKVRMGFNNETLLISFYDGNGDLVVEIKRGNTKLIECTNGHTKLFFDTSFAGDGARTKQQILISFSRNQDSVLIDTSVTQWTGWLFLPDTPQVTNFSGLFSINY